jgi:hypothetical protein
MWLQNTMAAQDKPSKRYDRSSGNFLTPIKFVTACHSVLKYTLVPVPFSKDMAPGHRCCHMEPFGTCDTVARDGLPTLFAWGVSEAVANGVTGFPGTFPAALLAGFQLLVCRPIKPFELFFETTS